MNSRDFTRRQHQAGRRRLGSSTLISLLSLRYLPIAALILCIWYMGHLHHLASLSLIGCGDNHSGSDGGSLMSPSLIRGNKSPSIATPQTPPPISSCRKEYDRISAKQTSFSSMARQSIPSGTTHEVAVVTNTPHCCSCCRGEHLVRPRCYTHQFKICKSVRELDE
jgi:hypothetical protein